MSLALDKENFFWHKLQSLTGIIPAGFYMLQHLTLNSYSIAGPDKFNGVIEFFDSLPPHVLLGIEILLLWVPIAFHAIYGLLIVNRSQPNNFREKYGWWQNWMYFLQRVSGVVLFLFLIAHVATTTGEKYYTGSSQAILFDAWRAKLTNPLWLLFYMAGVMAASYHLAYGVWNFCIRWGITISEKAQLRIQRFAAVMFVLVTFLGWAALGGFVFNKGINVQTVETPAVQTGGPSTTSGVTGV